MILYIQESNINPIFDTQLLGLNYNSGEIWIAQPCVVASSVGRMDKG